MYPSMFNCAELNNDQRLLAEQHYKLVYSSVHLFLRRFNGNYLLKFYDFDDLVSVANIAYCRAIKSYDPSRSQLSTWVNKIVFEQLRTLIKYCSDRVPLVVKDDKQVEQVFSSDLEYGDPSVLYNETIEKHLIKKAAKRANLTTIEKQVIDMVVCKGMKQIDVAKVIKKSESTISRAKRLALDKIKKEYLKLTQ